LVSQLHTTIANLRLSLAELGEKERRLDSMISQFRTQLRRLPRQVIYGRTSLDASLAAMGEIEERLADSVAIRQRVLIIKKAATEELRALELVGKLDEARRSIQTLKQEAGGSDEAPEAAEDRRAEINRLEQYIAEHSKQAELAITAGYQEREDG
jgi:hypothetical protein